ncbi:MAG: hypothetical protein QW103_01185 [Candidatus Pacearchaeota archaeon]
MLRNKKGAEESNVIIFIILALVVAGLVVYFSWKFFGTAGNIVDAGDPTVTIAVEACRLEIQRQAISYCNSEKRVNLKAGGEMIVSCYYIDNNIKKGAVSEGIEDKIIDKKCENEGNRQEEDFMSRVCQRALSSMNFRDAENFMVNGQKCKNYYNTLVNICDPSDGSGIVNNAPCKCINTTTIYNVCLAGQKCNTSKTEVSALCTS